MTVTDAPQTNIQLLGCLLNIYQLTHWNAHFELYQEFAEFEMLWVVDHYLLV
jgi:hypothetical protein